MPVAPGAVPWDPDFVVFLNDVFFCWGMVLRLMGYRADITCGMDFWQNRGARQARGSTPCKLLAQLLASTSSSTGSQHQPQPFALER
jgi:hypothetical protein